MRDYLLRFSWISASLIFLVALFFMGSKAEAFEGYGLLTYFIDNEIFGISFIKILALLLISVGCLITAILVYLHKYLVSDSDTLCITNVKIAEVNYIPMYIGYFVLAFDIETFSSMFYIIPSLIIFIYFTKLYYFNPFLIFLGYHYYEVDDSDGNGLLFISNTKNLKIQDNKANFSNLIRFNENTFFEYKKEQK